LAPRPSLPEHDPPRCDAFDAFGFQCVADHRPAGVVPHRLGLRDPEQS
jgi:hypothetical protein